MTVQASIVFMGTPDFAVPPLQALHAAGYTVSLVVTQPDRPKGRGRLLTPPPVKAAALDLGCNVAQPASVRDPVFIERLRQLQPDFFVVVAFGQILPVALLKIPPRGAVNIHASLLPRYRGPAPIQWAMIRGEKETGITTILMDSGIDTGDLLLSAKTDIQPEETAEQLHCRLARMGAEVVLETLERIIAGSVCAHAQKHDEASYAPMLKKEDGHINWHQTAEQLDLFIRAMTPWPGAYCFWDAKRLKIIKARPKTGAAPQAAPGTIVESFPDELRVAVQNGVLMVDEIQSQSGKCMSVKDFLRGTPLPPGTVLA